jgi:hypothetical protein
MKNFAIRAELKVPVILKGYSTLDALLMSVLGKGNVSELLKCVDDLYYASAALPEELGLTQRASFVASMRPEHTPEWRNVLHPNTRTEGLPKYAEMQGAKKMNDLRIGLARQREAGNILNDYPARYTPVVEWHAVGDAEAVFEVLKRVPFIGKRRAAGYGEVDEWSILESDLDGIVGYANEPLRPIPVERWPHGGNWVPEEAAWKAPYWEVRNRTKCFVPQRL